MKRNLTVRSVLILLLLGSILLLSSQTMAFTAARDLVAFDPAVHAAGVLDVKFRQGLEIRLREGELQDVSQSRSPEVAQGLTALPNGRWEPLFTVSEPELSQIVSTGSSRSGQPLPDLNLYFRLQLEAGEEELVVMESLRSNGLVEGVYPLPQMAPPPLPPDYSDTNAGNYDTALGRNVYQRYLDDAPDGLAFRWAWSGVGGSAKNMNLCDVEYGYTPHLDLPPITLLGGDPDPLLPTSYLDHGTAVLGQIAALNNGWGTTGMAYNATLYLAPVKLKKQSYNPADAILRCVNQLKKGDVILIEQQVEGRRGSLVPLEWHKPSYDAIKVAVASGMVVVAAAGNSNENLDNSFYNSGHAPFASRNDSGAILVGAGQSAYGATPRARISTSNYGQTLDLQGWGTDIVTTGYGAYYDSEGSNLSYTHVFNGSSGAAPMVASAALIAQATYKAKSGTVSPATIKGLLRQTGLPQAGNTTQNIGPQPDMEAAVLRIWDLPAPAAPVITPAGGTYQMPLQASIGYGAGQNASNTHIRYTLNGSDPTFDDFIFFPDTDQLYLNYGVTLKARAFVLNQSAGHLLESPVSSAVYSSSTPKVETPVISPGAGTYNQPHQVTITTSTPGATIRYRTDGRAPSFFYPGTEYTGPITLEAGSYEVTARGYKDGYYKSDTAYSGDIIVNALQLPSPTIYPNSGTFNGSVTVYIGSTVLGAEIRYTLDGSDPTDSSPLFDSPLQITSSTTVKARVFLDGYTASDITEHGYTVIEEVTPPVFDPVSGTTADDTLSVSLSTTTPGATIRYTTNGAEPTSYSTAYTGPFALGIGEHTVKAKSFLNGLDPSETVTAEYTVYDSSISISEVTITPGSGQYNGPISVTLSTTTEVDLIFYTLDGNDPAAPPPGTTVHTYSSPFELPPGESYFIRARAFRSGAGNSDLTAANITVVEPTLGPVETPLITPAAGTYHNPIEVRVEASDFSAPFNVRRLYVTTDGLTPFADFGTPGQGSGGVYTFDLDSSAQVQALAAQVGWIDSQIATAEYLFECGLPTLTPSGTYTTAVQVSLETATTNATLYYTTDGSPPDSSAIQYTTPFTLTESSAVNAICVRDGYFDSPVASAAYNVVPAPQPPTILNQPESLTVAACEPALLAVNAAGDDPLSYVWMKDGAILAGENAPELEIPAALLSDAGQYQVAVSNPLGILLSERVTLTVTGDDAACLPPEPQVFAIYIPLVVR